LPFYQSDVGPAVTPVAALGHSLVTPRPVRKIPFF